MTQPELMQRFVGTWRLAAMTSVRTDGTVTHPLSPEPLGYLTYTADGHMHAILVHPDPAKANHKTAYAATWTIRGPEVVHSVTAALVPEWIGTDLVRTYDFDDGRMTLTAHEPDRQFRLVWRRVNP